MKINIKNFKCWHEKSIEINVIKIHESEGKCNEDNIRSSIHNES